ncbi:YhcN/YlaJ family sporulation lipoprotein [Bacillus taeanensis]|uniref:Sporulation protein n=1 Tax=Bacillus taeanensis TaxID=273032 RepID=A0A366Y2X0_9BACI|nr:YhcN/YlaJ family sporulation lipoprotein [Bacillus taeanensis]RBW70734.1 hypothetical protein DS031_04420 [Bacillus taeanensis]
MTKIPIIYCAAFTLSVIGLAGCAADNEALDRDNGPITSVNYENHADNVNYTNYQDIVNDRSGVINRRDLIRDERPYNQPNMEGTRPIAYERRVENEMSPLTNISVNNALAARIANRVEEINTVNDANVVVSHNRVLIEIDSAQNTEEIKPKIYNMIRDMVGNRDITIVTDELGR